MQIDVVGVGENKLYQSQGVFFSRFLSDFAVVPLHILFLQIVWVLFHRWLDFVFNNAPRHVPVGTEHEAADARTENDRFHHVDAHKYPRLQYPLAIFKIDQLKSRNVHYYEFLLFSQSWRNPAATFDIDYDGFDVLFDRYIHPIDLAGANVMIWPITIPSVEL